jgi:hypothetical protein
MNTVARMTPADRADLFRETAARRGDMLPGLAEKDFWVC